MATPRSLIRGISTPLCSHWNMIGVSPVMTAHCTVARLSMWDGSSPKLNGEIFGRTKSKVRMKVYVNFMQIGSCY